MSAVLPCLRLYYWLGCQLGRLQTARDNPYAGKLDTVYDRPLELAKTQKLFFLDHDESRQSGLRHTGQNHMHICHRWRKLFWTNPTSLELTVSLGMVCMLVWLGGFSSSGALHSTRRAGVVGQANTYRGGGNETSINRAKLGPCAVARGKQHRDISIRLRGEASLGCLGSR